MVIAMEEVFGGQYTTTIDSCLFMESTTSCYGGAVAFSGHSLRISSFFDNIQGYSGDSIYSSATLFHCWIQNLRTTITQAGDLSCTSTVLILPCGGIFLVLPFQYIYSSTDC